MSHDYHEGQPNYNPHQLYYDGCAECRRRAADPVQAFEHIKDLQAAWYRAFRFEKGLLKIDELPISETEAPVLRTLWALIVKFTEYGFPINIFPGDVTEIQYPIGECSGKNKRFI